MQGCSDRRFGEMSEGERQMVLVVRALARRPELLVLDEPCQGLDPGRRDRFLKILEETLRTTDTTLIYVTHDPDEIPSAMTHGLLLRSGTAALEGSVTETLEAYLDG
jgi:ABC-type molybdenum transport system ATPase subunit/photorepair protein PhrA